MVRSTISRGTLGGNTSKKEFQLYRVGPALSATTMVSLPRHPARFFAARVVLDGQQYISNISHIAE
jgi:hypothetical protein